MTEPMRFVRCITKISRFLGTAKADPVEEFAGFLAFVRYPRYILPRVLYQCIFDFELGTSNRVEVDRRLVESGESAIHVLRVAVSDAFGARVVVDADVRDENLLDSVEGNGEGKLFENIVDRIIPLRFACQSSSKKKWGMVLLTRQALGSTVALIATSSLLLTRVLKLT